MLSHCARPFGPPKTFHGGSGGVHVSFDAGRLARKIPTHLRTLSCKMATSPLSGKQAFEPARSPRAFADSVRSVRFAGLYAFGTTSVCDLAGAGGAGAIRRLCHRCARVARGRGSRLSPLGHGPCARSLSARAAGHWSSVAGSDELVPVWQVVDADLRVQHGLCAARRLVLGQRTLLWRRRRRRRRVDDARARRFAVCCIL